MKIFALLLILSLATFCSSFYILAPYNKSQNPFCYINALSISENNVLHWKIIEPRPRAYTLYVTITDKKGKQITSAKSSLEEDTLAFQSNLKDIVRVCVESDAEEGLKVHLGYRLAASEKGNDKIATLKQSDHLGQIVFDASNKLENFMVSEKSINENLDYIHNRGMVVANNLKTATRLEIGLIVVIFLFQFWHLRRYLLSKNL